MANARSHFDTLADYLAREHETHLGKLYGVPAILRGEDALVAFYRDGLAVRVHGRAHDAAKGLPGVRGWNPLRPLEEGKEWLLVPPAQMMRWDRLALEAIRCARERAERGRMALAKVQVFSALARDEQEQNLGERFKSLLARGLSSFGLS